MNSRRLPLDHAALTLPSHAPAVAGTGGFTEVPNMPLGGYVIQFTDPVTGEFGIPSGGWTMALAEYARILQLEPRHGKRSALMSP